MAQKWKRRARAGQQWPLAVQPDNQIGKRKNLEGHIDGTAEGEGIMEKRLKLKGGRELKLHNEEIDLEFGSGMAVAVTQPCRPV